MARLLALIVAALAGGAAGWIASGSPRQPELDERVFEWAHEPGETRRITDSTWLHLTQQFADFDLDATVELPDGGELDVVFRIVQPRLRPTAEGGEQLVPFHARFTLLRLSAIAAGPPYRTREQALFADDSSGGVKVAAGRPASIRLEARGRRIRAYVAGRWMRWVEATDDHGSIAFVARGGTTLLSHLKIRPVERAGARPAWLATGVLAILAALVLLVFRAPAARVAVTLALLLPAGAWAAREVLFVHLLPDLSPGPLALSVGGLCALPLAMALSTARRRWWAVLLGALVLPLLLEGAARLDRERLAPMEDPRLDLYFGPDACEAPLHALARRLRSATRVHTVEGDPVRVMFLGGAAMFEARPDIGDHVGLRTAAALRLKLGRDVEGVVVTTPLPNALQQLLMFRRFYLDFAPHAVVFGVSGMESATGERLRARELYGLARAGPIPERPAVLWEMYERLAPGDQPIATPEDLSRTLAELDELCRSREIPLVLVTEAATDPAMVAALAEFARSNGIPLVKNVVDEAGAPRIDELVAVLAAEL